MILYIEDDYNNRILIKRVLEAHGIDIVLAKDAYEGFDILKKTTPELILMDINMPGMNGYELTTKIKSNENYKKITVVALTVASKKGEREMAIMAGCDGFISKPIDVDSFPDQIAQYLSGKVDIVPAEDKSKYLTDYSRRLVARLEEKIEEIESSRKEWEETFNSLSDIVIVLDTDYSVIKVNNSGHKFFNLKTEDLVGKKCCDIFGSNDDLCPHYIIDNCKNEIHNITEEIAFNNNENIFLLSISPVFDENNSIKRFIYIAKDITAIRNAQREIEERVGELEIFNKVSVGRELKMIELKEKIALLENKIQQLEG